MIIYICIATNAGEDDNGKDSNFWDVDQVVMFIIIGSAAVCLLAILLLVGIKSKKAKKLKDNTIKKHLEIGRVKSESNDAKAHKTGQHSGKVLDEFEDEDSNSKSSNIDDIYENNKLHVTTNDRTAGTTADHDTAGENGDDNININGEDIDHLDQDRDDHDDLYDENEAMYDKNNNTEGQDQDIGTTPNDTAVGTHTFSQNSAHATQNVTIQSKKYSSTSTKSATASTRISNVN